MFACRTRIFLSGKPFSLYSGRFEIQSAAARGSDILVVHVRITDLQAFQVVLVDARAFCRLVGNIIACTANGSCSGSIAAHSVNDRQNKAVDLAL